MYARRTRRRAFKTMCNIYKRAANAPQRKVNACTRTVSSSCFALSLDQVTGQHHRHHHHHTKISSRVACRFPFCECVCAHTRCHRHSYNIFFELFSLLREHKLHPCTIIQHARRPYMKCHSNNMWQFARRLHALLCTDFDTAAKHLWLAIKYRNINQNHSRALVHILIRQRQAFARYYFLSSWPGGHAHTLA